jgi:predicted RNase H-like HicB family nuclease
MQAMTEAGSAYVGLFETGVDGSVSVFFPDVPGCVSGGDTLDEAHRSAIEALMLHLDGVPRPQARSLVDLLGDPTVRADVAAGCVPMLVPVLAPLGRSVRVNLSMDEGQLQAIDAGAKARGLTRSAFLAASALARIEAEGQ